MKALKDALNGARRILITTHRVPDGDGLGSAVALYLYLKQLGKEVTILNVDPTPPKFSFLTQFAPIGHFSGRLPPADLVCIVDTNELTMLGAMGPAIEAGKLKLCFIDHHALPNGVSTPGYIDESFGSTGELIYEFLKSDGAQWSKEICTALYVALHTDSSSFRFKGVSARYHEIAAQLIKRGADSMWIEKQIYSRDSAEKLRLLGFVLSQIKVSLGGKIAWIEIGRALRNRYGASIEDTESFINQLTVMDGAEIVLLFREEDDGKIKVSIRGLGRNEVLSLARKLGGGGHEFASGARLSGSLESVVKKVIAEAEQLLLDAAEGSQSAS